MKIITFSLLGGYPNTYVYTKSIAEDIVKNEGKDLPVAVIRPSIGKHVKTLQFSSGF